MSQNHLKIEHPEIANRKLYSHLRFCGNIMCIAGPNDNLWLTKANEMDKSGCDMPNGSNFALFWTVEGAVGPHGSDIKNWRFCSYGNFEDKNHRFTCLLGTQGCDSFPKHIDLTLVSNKTNGGVKSQ